METLHNIFQAEIIQRLGWTLLHFVWQATAIGMILAIVLKLLHKSSANLRYIIASMALTLIVLMPAATIRMVDVSVEAIEPIKPAAVDLPKTDEATPKIVEMPQEKSQPAPIAVAPRIPLKDRFIEAVEPALPFIVLGWLVGVFGLSVWNLGGWRQLRRLRWQMVNQVSERIHLRLKYLAEQMGIKRAVAIMQSALVQVPTVVGWLKPVILLPASALTGLSGEQLEAILAHELAHIKRCDYLVNMLQTVVEILGFYHPAVWWVSHKIRLERENCCDDMAVSLCSDRICYAKALTTMEEIRAGQLGLAVAASGASLFERIKRLLGKDSANEGKLSWLPSAIAILLIAGILIPTTLALSAGERNKPNSQEGYRIRHFVRVVTDDEKDRVTFEGQELDCNEFPENFEPLLENMPDRANTVLEIAFAPGTMPEKGSMAWLGIVHTLSRLEEKYGFEYLSIVGEHPLGSKGGPSHVYFTSRYKSGKEIDVNLRSVDKLLFCKSIKFKHSWRGKISALLQLGITSYPKTIWELRLRLLDEQSKELKAVYQTFENSGVIPGFPVHSEKKMNFAFSKVANLGKVKSFELRIRQIQPETQKPAPQNEPIKRTDTQHEKIDYSSVTVEEGVGFDDIIFGCTGEFIKSKLGKPDKEIHNEKDWWLNYKETYGLGFWVNPQEDFLIEIRLNKRFKGQLTSGISMASTKEEVFNVYGKPVKEETVENFDERYDNQVLLHQSGLLGRFKPSKIYYDTHGLLFWFDKDEIEQIVVYRKKHRMSEQTESFKQLLEEPVTVHIEHSPESDKLSVQYAVMAVCKAAGVPYNWDKSAEWADPERRQYVEPINIEDKVASQTIADMVGPVGLLYGVDANGVYLYKPEKAGQDKPIKKAEIQSTDSSSAPQILTSAYILSVPADLPQL